MAGGMSIPITGALMGPGASGGAAADLYAQRLINVYGATEVWPLIDMTSGTTITATNNVAWNGTCQGWDLQNAAGPIASEGSAPYSDGANDYGNILSAGLTAAFSKTELSMFCWGKVPAGVWTDGANRRLAYFLAGISCGVLKSYNNNQLVIFYYTGAPGYWVFERRDGISPTTWFSCAFTVSETADEGRGYFNGTQEDPTLAKPGALTAGALSKASIGSEGAATTTVWLGHKAYVAVKFGAPVWTPTQIAAMHNDVSAGW